MNYSNMIKEEGLKKTFIIATLASTLVGTFTSSMGLWDRVTEKRKQTKRDTKQDEEIKNLRTQIEKAEKRNKEFEEDRDRDRDRRKRRDEDEVGNSLERSGAMIRREYDEGFKRLGDRFAVGDSVTENQLQAQIIALQQTVINVLQDALYNDRNITPADMKRLLTASQAAREGSLDALRQQYQRMAIEPPRERAMSLRQQSPPSPQRALPPPKRASSVIESDSIFCRYSEDLQFNSKKPLSVSFAPGGGGRCPGCAVRLDVEPSDFWQIGKRIPVIVTEGRYEREVLEDREFHLGQRFVIKCHTVDGKYACILCNKYRNVDAICGSVESLVNHVGRSHDISELEREVDLREKPPQLALPPPPPPSIPETYAKETETRRRQPTLVEYR